MLVDDLDYDVACAIAVGAIAALLQARFSPRESWLRVTRLVEPEVKRIETTEEDEGMVRLDGDNMLRDTARNWRDLALAAEDRVHSSACQAHHAATLAMDVPSERSPMTIARRSLVTLIG